MTQYTIIHADGFISKDGAGYSDLTLSWLPDDILAVQAAADGSADVERGVRSTLKTTANESVADVTTLSWWSNVDTTWQAAYDAEQAAIAAAEAESGD
ncbi:hypothetical protein OAE49_06215 [Gammaproteobacteria bacterium]|nr:hypothetical protein [Gammaproteobacteria bacterium]